MVQPTTSVERMAPPTPQTFDPPIPLDMEPLSLPPTLQPLPSTPPTRPCPTEPPRLRRRMIKALHKGPFTASRRLDFESLPTLRKRVLERLENPIEPALKKIRLASNLTTLVSAAAHEGRIFLNGEEFLVTYKAEGCFKTIFDISRPGAPFSQDQKIQFVNTMFEKSANAPLSHLNRYLRRAKLPDGLADELRSSPEAYVIAVHHAKNTRQSFDDLWKTLIVSATNCLNAGIPIPRLLNLPFYQTRKGWTCPHIQPIGRYLIMEKLQPLGDRFLETLSLAQDCNSLSDDEKNFMDWLDSVCRLALRANIHIDLQFENIMERSPHEFILADFEEFIEDKECAIQYHICSKILKLPLTDTLKDELLCRLDLLAEKAALQA